MQHEKMRKAGYAFYDSTLSLTVNVWNVDASVESVDLCVYRVNVECCITSLQTGQCQTYIRCETPENI